jgi:hypothetical protein
MSTTFLVKKPTIPSNKMVMKILVRFPFIQPLKTYTWIKVRSAFSVKLNHFFPE